MPKAERKSPISQIMPATPSVGSMLDGLNVKVQTSGRKPKKTKKDGSPTWHQLHRTYRYYLEDAVYRNVAGIATTLNVENVSAVAAVLMEFALDSHRQGKVWMELSPNPNPKSTKMTLAWSHKEDGGWGRELKPDTSRKLRHARLLITQKQKVLTYGFRWPREFHNRITEIAAQYHVTIGAMTTRLLSYAVEEWHAGRLTIDTQPIVSHDVSGWGAK